MINVDEVKSKIIKYIENNGPSIPIKIAKEIEMDPIYAQAFLSELTSIQKVKTSNMKVGASQIFYLKGQEEKLEDFAEEYLKGPEKKAFHLLKESKFLVDNELEPAIRVALRSIKDFATPFKHEERIMWRYNFYPKDDIAQLLSNSQDKSKEEKNDLTKDSKEDSKDVDLVSEDTKTEKENLVDDDSNELKDKSIESSADTNLKEKEEIVEERKDSKKYEEPKESVSEKDHVKQEHLFEKKSEEKSEEKPEEKLEEKSKEKSEDDSKSYPFTKEVLNFLNQKQISLIETIEESRNELNGVIRVSSNLGPIHFLLIARNKKSITDSDILVSYQKASEQKMPCYLLHKGKLTKKGQETLDQYKNLIRVSKI